ncbi:MAG: LysE family transporter [Pseudomonadales bacterium]|nr:LysE family transporter [Pseudomonadales bacterium]
MFSALSAGFGLSLSLIIALGGQNLFLLRMGLGLHYRGPLVLAAVGSDGLLMALGVLGLGSVVTAYPDTLRWLTLGGVAMLVLYGGAALRRAWQGEALDNTQAASRAPSPGSAALTFLAITFLNPHVYLDTVGLVGAVGSRFDGAVQLAFLAGAVSASAVWFTSLVYGARLLVPLLKTPRAWRVLDSVIAAILLLLALALWGSLPNP